jgi:FkbM family methyltransferase
MEKPITKHFARFTAGAASSMSNFTTITHRYKSRVLRLTVPRKEAFLIGDIFLREEYQLRKLKGVFGKTTVVDVGANVGLFTVFIAMNIPGAAIHCFEPSNALHEAFRANTAAFPNIFLHPAALSDHDGRETFYLHPQHPGQSSLKFREDSRQDAPLVEESVTVQDAGSAFDALQLDSVDILKVDTEGSEVAILQSLGRRLDRVKHIYIEYHSEADKDTIHGLLRNFQLLHDQKRGEGVGVLRYMHRRFA